VESIVRRTSRSDRPKWRSLRAEKAFLAAVLAVVLALLGACDTTSASGYDQSRGYNSETLKLVFASESGSCINRFTYNSKLAPAHPEVVSCDSPQARIRDDGVHANAPGCIRIDYESLTTDNRAYYCLKYLVRTGYCYPVVTQSPKAPAVLLYAPSACDESLRLPQTPFNLGVEPAPPADKFSKAVVTDIKSPGPGQRCPSISVLLEASNEEVTGPGIPPAQSQLVCLAPK
jgi:hypothetical protein